MRTINFTWRDVYHRVSKLANRLVSFLVLDPKDPTIRIYGVPRGGVYIAQALVTELERLNLNAVIVGHPTEATLIVDDLIDSGETVRKYVSGYPHTPFQAAYNKQAEPGIKDTWIVFPWEAGTEEDGDGPASNITRILQYLGEDVEREGLKDTPNRVIKSYDELFAGYKVDVPSLFTTFEEKCDEMVVLRDIEFYSTCEHHMLPFVGKAHVGYIPNGKVVGISKLARLVEAYARRLSIQERVGDQVTEALMKHLKAAGAACVIESRHFCMCSRGVNKQESVMVTSSLKGVMKENTDARREFLSLIGK